MTHRRRLRASVLGAFLILGGGVASAASAATQDQLPNLGSDVTVSRLPAGGTAIVRPEQGAPVAAVELWFRAPSDGFGAKPVPAIARLAAQTVAASKPIVGDPLGKVVAAVGGRLSITVYSDSVSVSAVVPSNEAAPVVAAMTKAYFAPVVTDDGFRSAQHEVAQESLIATFDAETVVRDAVFGALFASGPQHYPALGEPKSIPQIPFADVRSFAARAFRSSNATLVVSGAVAPTIASAAVAGRSDLANEGPESAAATQLAATVDPVTKTFVQPSGGYGWLGPAIVDQREATAMDFIADYLFRVDEGRVSRAVAAKYPDSFVVGQFITLHDPGVMFVAFAGKDASAVRGLVDDGLAAMQKPMEPAAFANALTAFQYHLLSDLQTPTQQADNFGWYAVEGAPAYAPGAGGENGAYFVAARSLTPEYVASVAQKYLGKPPVVVTLKPATAGSADKETTKAS
jgi:predicted Zn-dependent peptidase